LCNRLDLSVAAAVAASSVYIIAHLDVIVKGGGFCDVTGYVWSWSCVCARS